MYVQPDISVCTTVKRQPLAARSMLYALQETAGHVALELFLVNLGDDKDEELLREFPDLKVFSQPGEVEGRGRNQALELAVGRYALLIDRDVLVQPGCLLGLVEFMDDNPDVGIASPRILNAFNKPENIVCAFHTIFSLLGQFLPSVSSFAYDVNRDVDWLWSGAIIIRQELIDDIGLPDATMPSCFSEMEYALRAKRAGWHNFYIYNATAIHPNPLKYDLRLANRPFSPLAALKFMKKKWLR